MSEVDYPSPLPETPEREEGPGLTPQPEGPDVPTPDPDSGEETDPRE